jgi:gliding motility-associated-like protein
MNLGQLMPGIVRILTIGFLLISTKLLGLNYYWIGGSGNWSDLSHWATTSGGTILHTTIPGTTDNVYFDGNSSPIPGTPISLTVNVNTIYARDLIFQPGCPAVTFSQNSYEYDLFGSLLLQPNVSLHLSGQVFWNFSGNNLHTIQSNGVPISRLRFKGVGTYTLLDSLWVLYDFSIENGGFQSAGNKISCQTFFAQDQPNSPIKNFSQSEIKVYRNGWHTSFELQGGGGFQFIGSNLQLVGNHARIVVQTSDTTRLNRVSVDGASFNELHFNQFGKIRKLDIQGITQLSNVAQVDTLQYEAFSYVALQESNFPLKISRFIGPASPCSGGLHFQGRQPTMCSLSVPSGIILNGVSFRNIQVSSIIANNGKNFGNNSGIIFVNSASNTYYWINGTGNWNDPSHWSTSSGGTSSNCIPGPLDHVVFDQNSGTSSSSITMPRLAYAHHFTSRTTIPFSFDGSCFLIVSGSIRANSKATFNFDDQWYPNAIMNFTTAATDSISIKRLIESNLYALGTGTLEFGDSTKIQHDFRILSGTAKFSNRHLSTGYFGDQWAPFGYYSLDTGFIDFNQATIEVQQGFYFDNHKVYWNETESVFKVFSNDGWGTTWSTNKAFWELQFPIKENKFNMNGQGFRVRKLSNSGKLDLYQYQPCDWDTLALGAESRITFQYPGTVTIDTIKSETSCNAFSSIVSTSDTTRFTLQSGPIQTQYLSLQNIKNQNPSVSWTSVTSNDLGGNENIIFTQGIPRTLYWVGGSGIWADSTHWSLSSGGPGGECLPTPVDSVIFNTASFSSISDTVAIGSTRAYSKDLVVSYLGDLRFDFDQQGILNPYGSVTFQKSTYPVSPSNGGSIEFAGGDSSYFKTNNAMIHVAVRIRKTGSLTLIDSLKGTWPDRGLDVYRGGFYSNAFTIYNDHVYLFPDNAADSAYVDLSGSHIEVLGDWESFIARGNLTYRDDSAHIFATNGYARVEVRDSIQIGHLEFTSPTNANHTTLTSSNGGRVNFLRLHGNLNFNGPSLINTLILKPDFTYLFDPNSTHTVFDSLRARGDFCHFIGIKSQIPSQQATLFTQTPVSGDFLEIRDLNYAGNHTFYTGANSTDQGNNTGFLWANQPGYIYGFPNDTVHLFCHGPNIPDSLELRTDNFNDAVGFIWSTGDTTSSIWISQSGTYWVGADYISCTVYDTITVHLNYLQPIAVPQTAVCAGSTVALSANAANSQFSYVWDHGDTNAITSVVVNQDTTLKVAIYRYGFLFCTDSIAIKASKIDSLTILTQDPFCHGDSTGQITVSAVHGGFGPYQFSWAHNPSLTSGTAVNLPQGCYIISATDTLGCVKTDTVCLSQPQPLSLQLNLSPPLCSYDFGSITATAQGGSGTYQITYSNFNPTQMLPGTYTINLFDSNGCHLDTTFILPAGQVFNYQLNLDTATCIQSNGAVTVIPGDLNAPYAYYWSAIPLFQGSTLPNLAPGATGYVVVIDTLSQCHDTASYTIPFGGIADAFFTVNQDQGPTPLVVQTSNANPSIALFNYWILNGDTVSNAIDTTFIFTQYGTYTLQHCLWDMQFDCTKCYELTITANPNPALEMPNVFSPNGDGINDEFTPAEVRDLDFIEIQIHSRNGQLIWQSSDYPFYWDGRSIMGGQCPAGVYFWTLRYREALSMNDILLNGSVTLLK